MLRGLSKRISTLGICGAGQMGTGIAIVAAATAKLHVKVLDHSATQIDSSRTFVHDWLKKEQSKGRIANTQEVAERISYTEDLSEVAKTDFIVEAVAERYEIKSKLLRELSIFARPGTIIASNTSSISLTKLAANVQRPDEVIGMHFMNPVPVMKLIEVIKGLQTSQSTLEKTLALAAKLGKETCLSADRPGFIANRVLIPYINEAINVLNEGIATREDIDKCMVLGTNVPMGPLTLADFIGLDTVLYILHVLHAEFGDSKYRASPLLVNYVNAGWHGKKAGKGFYDYTKK